MYTYDRPILDAVDNYKTHRGNSLIFSALFTLDLSMWEK